MPASLPLFDEQGEARPPTRETATAEALAAAHDEARALAAQLPAALRFGTSSWSFPGWAGLVYAASRSQSALARDGLAEYARHPLLRTVGIDRSYYAPIPVAELRRYAEQLPPGFPCCTKAPAAVGSAAMPGRDGRRAAARNPDFLSAERLSRDLLEPFALAFRDHAGPVLVECAPLPRGLAIGAGEFVERLDRLLEALPGEFLYAVELRQRDWLTPSYARVLARHGVAHVFNYWSAMPTPGVQASTVEVGDLPFVVIRLLLRPGAWYEQQRRRFQPFDRIVEPDEDMRAEVVSLVRRAVGCGLPAYVLVNNKAEGSAPLTIRDLARRLLEDQRGGSGSSRA